MRPETEPTNININWASKSGANISDGIKYYKRQNTYPNNPSSLNLFWYGTCDITKKVGKFIYPRFTNTEELISFFRNHLDSLSTYALEHNHNLGILEIPPIFTRIWNKNRAHPDWQQINDSELHLQIKTVNSIIQEYNTRHNYTSPKFYQDFVKTRRDRRKGKGPPKTRYSLDPSLLVDGVHPEATTAKKWVKRIIESSNIDQ